LGDRHSHNILLDRKTAEVVHIDLGVAFEQGRFLNTPELVPFRLTSNIVDGMGATGQPNNMLLILNTAKNNCWLAICMLVSSCFQDCRQELPLVTDFGYSCWMHLLFNIQAISCLCCHYHSCGDDSTEYKCRCIRVNGWCAL